MQADQDICLQLHVPDKTRFVNTLGIRIFARFPQFNTFTLSQVTGNSGGVVSCLLTSMIHCISYYLRTF